VGVDDPVSLDVKRIDAFSLHVRDCPTCSKARYAYIHCAEGLKLANRAMTPPTWAERQEPKKQR
jgi:hypothetical protein